MNEPHFYLLLFSSVMNLYPRSLRFMTFTALCCEHSGFYQLQKMRALHELMQPHLCPAMDPILVQPHITRPLPPASSHLGICPDQTPTLLSTQLTLLLQPFSDPSSHSGSSSRSSDREQASSAPINISSSSPYLLNIQLCWLCGVLSHPICLYTLVPLSQSQGSLCQDPEGRWALPFLPAPPGGARVLPLPLALSGCTWLFMSPATSPQAVNAGRRLSPVCSVPRPLPLLCLLPGCFPRESQGSLVSLSKRAAPLAFSLEHTAQPNSAFSIIVQCVPLCTVQSIVFYLDFSVSSALRTVPGSSTNLC